MRLGRRSNGVGTAVHRVGGRSCIVPAMDDDRPAPEQPDPSRPGPLTRETAIGLLARADDLLHAGEYQAAATHYVRVVGFDDPAVTAAALLGLGEARYRLDDEDGAVANWEAVVQLGETPSTYRAWRNLAASSVRMGALGAAMRAYREADHRAPPEDKAEIANRLGWLAKETGDTGTAKRYFARGRGDGPLVPLTMVVIVATAIVSLVAMLTVEGAWLNERPPARQAGGGGRRVLAPVDGHPRPRRPAAPVLQHVRAVPRRPDRRALVRVDPVPGLLSDLRGGGLRRELRVRARRHSPSGHPVRSSDSSASSSRRAGSITRWTTRAAA